MTADLAPVERRLRAILEPYRGRFAVVGDGPKGIALHLRGLEDQPHGFVAGVRPGKRYVSYYLMAVYASPDLGRTMSPELQRRMQGKSCFNFAKVDERLMSELETLTARGLDEYETAAATGQGPFAAERFRPAREAAGREAAGREAASRA
jgi:hypothetical protein